MGFAIMQNFMDAVRVRSAPGKGTTIELRKRFAESERAEEAAVSPQTDADTADGSREDIA